MAQVRNTETTENRKGVVISKRKLNTGDTMTKLRLLWVFARPYLIAYVKERFNIDLTSQEDLENFNSQITSGSIQFSPTVLTTQCKINPAMIAKAYFEKELILV